jgi:hypothetical protein
LAGIAGTLRESTESSTKRRQHFLAVPNRKEIDG